MRRINEGYYKENFTREKFMDNMESALHAACELEG